MEQEIKNLSSAISFIKYQFSDMQGNLREVTLTRENVIGKGITTVDGSSAFGKIIPPTESDMILIPDKTTLAIIPWTTDTARVICSVAYPEKSGHEEKAFEGCPRNALRMMIEKTEKELTKIIVSNSKEIVDKIHVHMAPEIEFILLDQSFDFTKIHTCTDLRNSNYFIPPQEKVDAAIKDMLKYLGMMGLKREKYHTEVTTYQYEIGIAHGNALTMADGTMTLKYIIKNVAERHGLRASFIPKFRKGVNGSGMHVHQNLAITSEGKQKNLFYDPIKQHGLSDYGRWYIAGLLLHAKEITALTNPSPISYKRLVPGCEAPTYIAWDWQNRTALCRGHSEGTSKVRIEYRSPDPQCNPYLAFAGMLAAGMEGIMNKYDLPQPDKRNYYHDNAEVEELPQNLGESLECLNQSKMLRKWFDNFMIDTLYTLGKKEWREYIQEVSDIDIKLYF